VHLSCSIGSNKLLSWFRYQQEGINWLAFLKRFKLHGILCDDMGLGKTLQASAIVASDTVERANVFAVSKSPDVAPLPSLVVCPSTLVGHWAYEIEKFIPTDVLNPLQYAGSPQERVNLRSRFPMHNIVITSYDVLRKDIDALAQQVWNYCILDEGHIIKSAKSKITVAAKRIQADHRLLLSGTPIQNSCRVFSALSARYQENFCTKSFIFFCLNTSLFFPID
jgi:TATA-binding protein-associated factor